MFIAEHLASHPFFVNLRSLVSRRIRLKAIRIRRTPELRDFPNSMRIEWYGIPVTIVD